MTSTMTVGALRAILAAVPDDTLVVMDDETPRARRPIVDWRGVWHDGGRAVLLIADRCERDVYPVGACCLIEDQERPRGHVSVWAETAIAGMATGGGR